MSALYVTQDLLELLAELTPEVKRVKMGNQPVSGGVRDVLPGILPSEQRECASPWPACRLLPRAPCDACIATNLHLDLANHCLPACLQPPAGKAAAVS